MLPQDSKWIIDKLDNNTSYIHNKEFRKLKQYFIESITTEYIVDSLGTLYGKKVDNI